MAAHAGPNASVHAYAAAQVKAAMDATKRLAGENYVFWGGREGYHTLLNTDLKCAALHPWLAALKVSDRHGINRLFCYTIKALPHSAGSPTSAVP